MIWRFVFLWQQQKIFVFDLSSYSSTTQLLSRSLLPTKKKQHHFGLLIKLSNTKCQPRERRELEWERVRKLQLLHTTWKLCFKASYHICSWWMYKNRTYLGPCNWQTRFRECGNAKNNNMNNEIKFHVRNVSVEIWRIKNTPGELIPKSWYPRWRFNYISLSKSFCLNEIVIFFFFVIFSIRLT